MRLLEQQLGRSLFVRNKSAAALTRLASGLLRYAPTFVQLWQRAPPSGVAEWSRRRVDHRQQG
jgi:DNA-binding transcriptional LysR family regulator